MISPPPKTGDTKLDSFLESVYEHSHSLIPEDGWSLSDFEADVSEVIGDKRDLIDIVTQYDDIERYGEVIAEQQGYLDSLADELRLIDQHSEWFAEIMEWWDQNYKIINDAQTSLDYKREADEAALEAKGHAEKTEQDRIAAAKSLVDSIKAVSDASGHSDTARVHKEDSKRYSEASEGFSEASGDYSAVAVAAARVLGHSPRTSRILVHEGTGDPVLSDFPDAQVGDIIIRVSDGDIWEVKS